MKDSTTKRFRSLRWIADRNPFYMLSACCGLVGCWLLGDMSRPDAIDVVIRIGGVVTYELAAVLLGVWLSKRFSATRDAAILAVVTLILTADFSFFYTQAAMLPVLPAGLLSLFGAAQALFVTGILLRGYRVRIEKSGRWLLGLDLLAIHFVPLLLRLSGSADDGRALTFLAAFSGAGLVIAAHAWPESRQATVQDARGLPRALGWITPVVMLVSLVAHVIASEWVYVVPFTRVYASPIILGIAALCLRREAAGSQTDGSFRDRLLTPGRWACAMAIFAVTLAWTDRRTDWVWNADGWSWFGVSPLRLILATATAVFWGQWRLRREHAALALAGGAGALALFGHTPATIFGHIDGLDDSARRLFPRSRAAWGAFLFTMAFFLLGAGGWISWWRGQQPEGSPDKTDSTTGAA
ncbi:MAG TPA: hypothetical protein VFY29_00030 [Terriglobia bacterium]|nr:hypothetical protein [Terriglobia bacterium]